MPYRSGADDGSRPARSPSEARELVLERRTSAEDAAALVRRWIFDGELRPGDRVPQNRVAQELGVSRIPVREALIALDREGWVRIEMHRGVFVSALDEATIRDHYDLLALVYGFAIRRLALQWRGERPGEAGGDDGGGAAARHRAAAVFDDLERELRDATEVGALYPLAYAFHATVAQVARAPRFRSLLRAMSPLVPGDFFQLDPGAFTWQRDALLTVLAAIRGGDPDMTAERYRDMMRRNTDLVIDVFRRRGLFDAREAR